ncbi:MAG: NADH-quinone oxidoreductase subunit NuoE [Anaerolineae bacterium]|jgi:NADH:ubiquinone oxidoreductase subunit E|nr:NADH-quinone oxidoreductase subunit NuoE [Anaerolineae bacterium]
MSTNPEVVAEEKKTLVLTPEEKQKIDTILVENRNRPGATMLVLTLVQEAVGYVSLPMQEYIANALGVPLSHLYGVLTFYSSFRMTPMGRHSVNICLGTACYVRGGPTLVDKFKQVLGVEMNETTADDRFTLQICRCVGACSQAPVVMIDDDVIGRVDPAKVPQILKKYE